MGIRPTVRGSVMNPNDHPHGGGEGRAPDRYVRALLHLGVNLHLDTRPERRTKHSNKYIVKRRNEK